jgi:hypothetical protein
MISQKFFQFIMCGLKIDRLHFKAVIEVVCIFKVSIINTCYLQASVLFPNPTFISAYFFHNLHGSQVLESMLPTSDSALSRWSRTNSSVSERRWEKQHRWSSLTCMIQQNKPHQKSIHCRFSHHESGLRIDCSKG